MRTTVDHPVRTVNADLTVAASIGLPSNAGSVTVAIDLDRHIRDTS